jgi:hypothetical protein
MLIFCSVEVVDDSTQNSSHQENIGGAYLSKKNKSQALVAHSCNPSYSGGRNQEDCGSKTVQANSFVRPYLKKNLYTHQKRAGVGPEFTSQYRKKTNKTENHIY